MDLSPETLETIEKVIPRYPQKRSAVMPLLQAIQDEKRYISDEAIEWVAAKLDLQPVNVYEVVTFYPGYKREPMGKTHIRLCRTLSCALMGTYKLCDQFKKELGIELDQTSEDGEVSLEFAECLASCGTGPVALLNDDLVENLNEQTVSEICQKINAKRPTPAEA